MFRKRSNQQRKEKLKGYSEKEVRQLGQVTKKLNLLMNKIQVEQKQQEGREDSGVDREGQQGEVEG